MTFFQHAVASPGAMGLTVGAATLSFLLGLLAMLGERRAEKELFKRLVVLVKQMDELLGVDSSRDKRGRRRAARAGVSAARGFASLAAWLAGSRRGYLLEAWLGDLRDESSWRALRAASGYLRAALVLRLADAAKPLLGVRAWAARLLLRLLDAVLNPVGRTRLVIGVILAALAAWLLGDQGFNLTIGDVVAFPVLWGVLDQGAAWLRGHPGLQEAIAKAKSLPGKPPGASAGEPPESNGGPSSGSSL
jgi:hypothetical protein